MENQKRLLKEINAWSEKEKLRTFFIEAFDDFWKGSNDPDEAERIVNYTTSKERKIG